MRHLPHDVEQHGEVHVDADRRRGVAAGEAGHGDEHVVHGVDAAAAELGRDGCDEEPLGAQPVEVLGGERGVAIVGQRGVGELGGERLGLGDHLGAGRRVGAELGPDRGVRVIVVVAFMGVPPAGSRRMVGVRPGLTPCGPGGGPRPARTGRASGWVRGGRATRSRVSRGGSRRPGTRIAADDSGGRVVRRRRSGRGGRRRAGRRMRRRTSSPRPRRARARWVQPYTLVSRTPRRSAVRALASS